MAASVTLPAAALSLLLAAAATDAKTGLLTHAAWRSTATHTVAERRPVTRSARWALLMLDLDHFAHLADDHLRRIATTLRGATGPDAVIGRFGGDEFTVLLPVADLPDLRERAEHLRRAVETLSVTTTAHNGTAIISGVTASIGGALHPFGTEDAPTPTGPVSALATLLWTADRALYEAKHAGRNTTRVRSADEGCLSREPNR